MTPTCPECGGSGEIVLLTSRRPCKACAARRAETANTMTFDGTWVLSAVDSEPIRNGAGDVIGHTTRYVITPVASP